jgi:hypothetical protein
MKPMRMTWAGHAHMADEKFIHFNHKIVKMRQVGRPNCGWEVNIKMYLK